MQLSVFTLAYLLLSTLSSELLFIALSHKPACIVGVLARFFMSPVARVGYLPNTEDSAQLLLLSSASAGGLALRGVAFLAYLLDGRRAGGVVMVFIPLLFFACGAISCLLSHSRCPFLFPSFLTYLLTYSRTEDFKAQASYLRFLLVICFVGYF